MAEKSLYGRPRMSPLAKYHLNAALKALSDRSCAPVMGELRFFDKDGELRKLAVVQGEWMEAEVIA